MKFETDGNDSGYAKFEGNERNIAHRAILNALVNAATIGGSQLERNDSMRVLAVLLLPENRHINKLAANAKHFEALAEAVSNSTENVPSDQTEEVGSFIVQLRVAANALNGNVPLQTPSGETIDRIIEQIVIPDTPEGLEP